MDDPGLVGEVQCFAQLAHDVDGFLDVEAFVRVEEVLEFLALDELHHDIRDFAFGAEVVHLHDVGVVQPRDRLGLAVESHRVFPGGVLVEGALQDGLDGDLAVQPGVHPRIDDTHRTLAEHGHNVVAPEALDF